MTEQTYCIKKQDPRIEHVDAPFKKMISVIAKVFGDISHEKGRRATHSYGTTALGTLEVLDNKSIPDHDVFGSKKRYPVLVRHANLKGFPDDGILDGRGAAIRILDGDPNADSKSLDLNAYIVDILMNTGSRFIFSDANTFSTWVAGDMKKRAEMLKLFPNIKSIFSEIIRNPDSYTKLHYYSKTSYQFVDTSGRNYFLRYRLVNEDDKNTDTGWIEADEIKLPLDFLPRVEGDNRKKSYLQDDFCSRVQEEGVNYLLQLQLQTVSEDLEKNEVAKDCTIPWSETLCPFLDVARISLTSILPDAQAESLEFNPYHAPPSLHLILAKTDSETASVNHLRSIVYQISADKRKYQLSSSSLVDWGSANKPTLKQQFTYAGTPGIDLPSFDAAQKLPSRVKPKFRYIANLGMKTLLSAKKIAESGKESKLGIIGVPEILQRAGAAYMPPNLTRMRVDKFSDDFFVERRLNGFNPGKMNPVSGKKWQYSIKYDGSQYKVDPSGIFPKLIEARFTYGGQHLHVHSIEYELDDKKVQSLPGSDGWEWAKRLFRCVEFVFQETQSHLARTHMNLDQYAMAFYRNIVQNPILFLLEPHLEGLLNINKQGASLIKGETGFITQASSLDSDTVNQLIALEVSELNYHHWNPKVQALPDDISNNHFDRAALAMWDVLEQYVDQFFTRHGEDINKHWAEIEAMSDDLVTHSILKKELGSLKICNMDDLRQLCIYVIYMSSFFHSWVNNKQYEDGGDAEYASIGLWDTHHPAYEPIKVLQRKAKQVILLWTLANVHYNPIMEFGSSELKNLLWKRRNEIEPGLALNDIMMSINI